MSSRQDYGPISDEDLVAYLDGMLDDDSTEYVEHEVTKDRALETRLEMLRAGERPFVEAFETVLREAPTRKLNQILDQTLNPPPPPVELPYPVRITADEESAGVVARPGAPKEPWRGWRLFAAVAILLAVFVAGLLASRFMMGLPIGPGSGEQPWRAAVANYQALLVKQTLEHAGGRSGSREAGLRAALSRVGLQLPVSGLTIPPLELQYASILNFGGQPFAQIAYLHNGTTPVSLCIIRRAKPPHGILPEQRNGLNIAYWQNGSHGFVVVGALPADTIAEIARQLRARLS